MTSFIPEEAHPPVVSKDTHSDCFVEMCTAEPHHLSSQQVPKQRSYKHSSQGRNLHESFAQT